MNVITIPKQFAGHEFVLIRKDEYEALKRGQPARVFKEVAMTKAQKRELDAARRDYKRGDFVTIDVLRRDLERRSSR